MRRALIAQYGALDQVSLPILLTICDGSGNIFELVDNQDDFSVAANTAKATDTAYLIYECK